MLFVIGVVGWLMWRRRLAFQPVSATEPNECESADVPLVSFACPQCDKKLKVKRKLGGRKLRCPYCNNTIAVPAVPARPVG